MSQVRKIVLVTAAAALVWLAAGVRRVDPSRELVVVERLGRNARVEGAFALAPAFLAKLARYPLGPVDLPFPDAEATDLPSADGGRYGLAGSVRIRLVPEEWRLAHASSGGNGLAGVLLSAVREACRGVRAGREVERAWALHGADIDARLRDALRSRGIETDSTDLRGFDYLSVEAGETVPLAGTRLLVVGLDGADWSIVDPLLAQGRLPNLARLVREGARAKLLTISPTLSPVIWTTVSTGVEPERHGILDFLVPDPAGGAGEPVTSAHRRSAAAWEILSDAGAKVGIVGWWATWPAEPVRGYLVSDRIAYQLFGYRSDADDPRGKSWPPELYDRIRPRIVPPESVSWEEVVPYLDGSRLREEQFDPEETRRLEDFRTLLASGKTYLAIADDLRRGTELDLEVVYFEGTDTVGHLFMPFRPPVTPGVDPRGLEAFGQLVDRYYETADRYLGRLLEGRGEEWTVMILSDHGFATDERRPRTTDPRVGHGAAADWHRKFGVLVLSGAGIRRGVEIEEANVYDIAPTILALFGQPVPRSWPGRVLSDAIDPSWLAERPLRYRPDDPPRTGLLAGGATDLTDPAGADVREKLRSLGYIGGAIEPDAGPTGSENNIGVALMAAGKLAAAEKVFREALRSTPGRTAIRVNLGITLRMLGKTDEAREMLTDVMSHRSAMRMAGHHLALMSLEASRLDEAESLLRRVLEGEPGASSERNTLGLVLERQGRLAEAEAEYRTASDLEPDAAEPRNNLGNLAKREGRLEEAESWYEEAIEADPYFMGAYNNLALLYQDRGEIASAIELYGRALEKSPRNAIVTNNLASLYYADGRVERAVVLWRRAAEADPEYPSPRNNLAGVAIARGDLDAAETWLAEALALDPGYGDARINRALVEHARGRFDGVRRELRLAAADPRARGRALRELGGFEFEQGRYEDAVEALEQAVEAGLRDPGLAGLLEEARRRLP